MEIKPEEVQEIKIIGKLNGDDVKMIKTYGGFHVAIGKKEKNSKKADALAGASHPALVSYQIEKMHGKDFQASIFKSEQSEIAKVEDLSDKLPDLAKSSGIEMFVLSKYNNLEFVMCKKGVELAKYEAEYNSDTLTIKKHSYRPSITKNKFIAEEMANAINNKVKSLNLKSIVREDK